MVLTKKSEKLHIQTPSRNMFVILLSSHDTKTSHLVHKNTHLWGNWTLSKQQQEAEVWLNEIKDYLKFMKVCRILASFIYVIYIILHMIFIPFLWSLLKKLHAHARSTCLKPFSFQSFSFMTSHAENGGVGMMKSNKNMRHASSFIIWLGPKNLSISS